MSNVQHVKIRPIPIVLDKPRTIVFDLNSFAELEEKYGDIQEVMDNMASGSIKALRLLLWAGLIHEQETLTPKDVGRLITFGDVPALTEMIEMALASSRPDKEEEGNLSPLAPKGAEVIQSELIKTTMAGTGDFSITPVQSS